MSYKVKTPLLAGEEIVMTHMATFLKGYPRPMGQLVLTNKRIIFEKKGGLNAATFGVFSAIMADFDGLMLSDITGARAEKSMAGAGMIVEHKSGESFGFALNGYGFSSKKKPRDEMVEYINSHNK